MDSDEWPKMPIGIDSGQWISRPARRTVLVVAHTVVSCHRLLDVIGLFEEDPRVQVVFTVAPDVFNRRVPRFLDQLGALVLPWQQVVRERFDLGVAAAHGGLPQLHAPLVVMAHGAGHGKRTRPAPPGRPAPTQPPAPPGGPAPIEPPVYGLDAQRLTHNGRVVPAALALAHDHDLTLLRRQCPDALPAAVVVGDPCHDRLVSSLHLRQRYRQSLGVPDGRQLVVVSSTWGRDGMFGRHPDVLPRLMAQLPADRYRVAALLHPAVWEAHGHRQIRAWLRDCRAAGLMLPDPTEDWRPLIVAADHVLGDHGSVTAYAAALGRPVLLMAGTAYPTTPGSPQAEVAARAHRLDLARPVAPQLRAAADSDALDGTAVAAALTSRPGLAAALLAETMYRLLRLDRPARHRRIDPAPVPRPERWETEA